MKQYIPKGPIGQKESWEIGKYFEMNENEDTVAEFMDSESSVRGKFPSRNAYIKEEIPKVRNLTT